MMVCAGAADQAVSQWASTFAEKGLGVAKKVGDLAGPMLFAFAGDIGCGGGPTLAGAAAAAAGDDLHRGILVAIIFPVLMLGSIIMSKKQENIKSK